MNQLNEQCETNVWQQTVGTDAYPIPVYDGDRSDIADLCPDMSDKVPAQTDDAQNETTATKTILNGQIIILKADGHYYDVNGNCVK